MKELLYSYRIAENDPNREPPLADYLYHDDMRIRHECKDMPEKALVYLSTENEKENWMVIERGRTLGLMIETCPYCGADLAHTKGDIIVEEFADPKEVHGVGKYGGIYKLWLEEHDPTAYKLLKENGRLNFECLKVEREAHRYALQTQSMLRSAYGENASDFLGNVRMHQLTVAQAEEIAVHDIVCVYRNYENGGK